MNQELADKANSALRIETVALPGTPISPVSNWIQDMGQGGYYNFTFDTGNETLTEDLRLSIYANFIGSSNDSVFVQILDSNDIPVDTGLRILNGPLTWFNLTLSSPSSYIDGDGKVTVMIVDASSQSDSLTLNIGYMAVYTDTVALEVTNIGGTDATLSRLWIVNTTQSANGQTDHVYADFNGIAPGDKLVVGGSARTIMLSDQTNPTEDGSILVNDVPAGNLTLYYAPPANQTVTFRVLSTLGNTAACTYDFS